MITVHKRMYLRDTRLLCARDMLPHAPAKSRRDFGSVAGSHTRQPHVVCGQPRAKASQQMDHAYTAEQHAP